MSDSHALTRLRRLLDSGRGTSEQVRLLVSELPRLDLAPVDGLRLTGECCSSRPPPSDAIALGQQLRRDAIFEISAHGISVADRCD